MKKICVITTARSDYGVLKWLMTEIQASSRFQLQIAVTGAHLLVDQGLTINQIIDDGFDIDLKVSFDYDYSSKLSIAKSMGQLETKMAEALNELKPDYCLVLGDRYELLPICTAAFLLNIPIIHLSGGDITEGAIDNNVRNAITMLASYHFPGTKFSADNLRRMIDSDKNIWVVGEPGLDAFNYERLMTRQDLADDLNLDSRKKWGLMTYHSETRLSIDNNVSIVHNILNSLNEMKGYLIVVTASNADYGGKQINKIIDDFTQNHKNFRYVKSLGHTRYLSFMKQVEFMIGNSSSGIIEAPFLNVPVINIGNRQKGRHLCKNIISCDGTENNLSKIMLKVTEGKNDIVSDNNYWGDGKTAKRIVKILENEI